MALSRRYHPEKPPSESCPFGMSFEAVIPPGVSIISGALSIMTNTTPPTPADQDWKKGDVQVQGRVLYAILGGGKLGTDYLLQWTATDSDGNIWPRTAMCLVANSS
jgi:hypothetical protein